MVVLSPGTHSETAFDQAFLASVLGLPLVESADLTVRGGRLWMRALGRYEPVDVVVRRVDAAWSDPLDLRPDSQLGVVGLTEACRRGTVTVVNTLGSGVLENPGLLPYLPALARELLGEESETATPCRRSGAVTTSSRSHVLAHFDQMVLRPTGPGSSVVPAMLSSSDQTQWRLRIGAEPTRWVGQQRASFSEAPVVGAGGLVAQRVGLRLFTVAHQSGYVAMPGGLGRVVGRPGTARLRRIEGEHPDRTIGGQGRLGALGAGRAVDLGRADQPAGFRPVGRADRDGRGGLTTGAGGPVLARSLRRAHRGSDPTADHGARIGRHLPFPSLRSRLRVGSGAAVGGLGGLCRLPGVASAGRIRRARMRQLVLDAATPGTVAQSLAGLQETARAVRDQLSGDTWMVLAGVDRAIAELAASPDDSGAVLQTTHAAILSGMLALSGLASENMVRDPGWRLMDIGRRLERGQQLAALLRATLTQAHPSDVESIVIESVLAVAESGLTYRRRYRGRVQVGTVLELLMLDAGNPRSLAYQVNAIADNLKHLPDASGTSRPERLTEELAATLRRARPSEMDDLDRTGSRAELDEFLTDIHDALRNLADAVAAAHFWRSRPMLPLGQNVRDAVVI